MTPFNKTTRIVALTITLCFLWATDSLAQDYQYDTRDDYLRSGYDYYWSVIQPEFALRSFDTQEQADQYFELLDIMVRTGTGYGHSYLKISLGITQMYPRLLKLDPDPPLFAQYRYQRAVFKEVSTREQDEEAGMALLEIARRMEDAEYPPLFVGETWLKAAYILNSAGLAKSKEAKDAYKAGIALVLEAARLEDIEPRFREHVAKKIFNFCYINRTHLTLDQMEQLAYKMFSDPQIDPWIAHTALGYCMSEKASKARGKKYSYKTNDAQWQMHRVYLAVAAEHLVAAWEMRPEWTAPAVQMISVTMGHQFHPDWDETFWLNEVTRYQYDHQLAYKKLATSKRARWGGGDSDMYALLDDIIEVSKTHEHMGHIFMFAASELSRDTDDPNEVFTNKHYLDHATRMMKEEIEAPLANLSPWNIRGNLSLLAMQHFMAKNYEEAAVLLKAGGAYSYSATFPKPWKADARYNRYNELLATDFTNEAILALQAADEGDIDFALKIIKEVQMHFKDETVDPYPHIISNHRMAINNLVNHIEAHGRD